MKNHSSKSHFLLLLLVCLIFSSPFWGNEIILDAFLDLLFTTLLALCGYWLQPSKRWLLFYICVTIPIIILDAIALLWGTVDAFFYIRYICIFLIQIQMLRAVFTHSLLRLNITTRDRVIAGVCGYLILALLFANIYELIFISNPDAFHGISKDIPSGIVSTELLYFSLVTLSTLGYGDITPALPYTRIFAAFQAVLGTLYLSVLVASLVAEVKFTRQD